MLMKSNAFLMLTDVWIDTDFKPLSQWMLFFPFRYVSQRCLHGTAREWIQ